MLFSAKPIEAQECQSNDRNQGLISALGILGDTIFGSTDQVCVIDTSSSYREFKVPSYQDLEDQFYNLSLSTAKKGKDLLTGPVLDFNQAGNGIYLQTDDLTISSVTPTATTTPPSGTQVIFVRGDLNITGNIDYADTDLNSGLVFVVSGNINIYNAVTKVNAVLISSGIICTAYSSQRGTCTDIVTTTSQLTINGSLISLNKEDLLPGNSAILLRRLLTNNTQPAEIIRKQPKYLYTLRNGLFTKDLIIVTEDKKYDIAPVSSIAPFPSIPGTTLATGLRSFWKLDDTSGNAADLMNINPLSPNPTVTYQQPGPTGSTRSIGMSGVSGGLRCTDASCGGVSKLDADPTKGFSYSFWLNPQSYPAQSAIFGKYMGSGQGYTVLMDSGGRLRVEMGNSNCTGFSGVNYQNITVPLNTWTHIVVTAPPTTINNPVALKIYKNGQLAYTSPAVAYYCDTNAGFALGTLNDGSNYPEFNIRMANVGIWAKELSLGEVTDLANGTIPSPSAPSPSSPPTLGNGLVGYWKFNETSGSTVADSSGNGLNGTFSGSGTHWTTGRFGGAGVFNGTDDYVNLGSSSTLKSLSSGPFTVGGWINTTQAGGTIGAIMGNLGDDANPNNNKGWRLVVSENKLVAIMYISDSTYQRTHSNITLTPGWHYVTLTWGNGGLKIYVDGQSNDSQQNQSPVGPGVAGNHNSFMGAAPVNQSLKYKGMIDEIAVWNRVLDSSEITALNNGALPPTSSGQPSANFPSVNLVSYWNFDEASGTNAADSKGSNHGTTNATVSTSGNKIGNARSLTNSTGPINIANPNNFTNQNFTFSTWIKATSYNGWASIFNIRNPGDNRGITLEFINGGNRLQAQLAGVGALASTNTIPLNQWMMVTLTYDHSNVKLYINGALEASTPSTQNIQFAGNPSVVLGRNIVDGSVYNGLIDEAGYWDRALTGTSAGQNCTTNPNNEICALYNSGAGLTYISTGPSPSPQIPLTQGLVGLWKMDEPSNPTILSDGSGQNLSLNVSGNLTSAPALANTVTSLTFANPAYASCTDSSCGGTSKTDPSSTNGFSFGAWVYPTAFTNPQNIIMGKGSWTLRADNTGKVRAEMMNQACNNDSGFMYSTPAGTLPLNQWTHLIVTVTPGNPGTLKIYKNGNSTPIYTSSQTAYYCDTTDILHIGGYPNVAASWTGRIDVAGVWQRTLSPQEIAELYNSGAGTQITASPSPSDIDSTNLVAHLKMNEASWNGTAGEILDSSSTGANGVRGGNATTTSGGRFDARAGSFDGNGDYLTFPDNAALELGNSDFTISTWINPSALPQSGPGFGYAIYSKDSGTAVFSPLALVWRDTDMNIHGWMSSTGNSWNLMNDTNLGGASRLTANSWHSIIFTRSNGLCKLYIDNQVTSETQNGVNCNGSLIDNANTHFTGGQFQMLSAGSTLALNGKMDDFRIYKRALTQNEIQALVAGTGTPVASSSPSSSPSPSPTGLAVGLRAYWKLDETAGSSVADSSGNNINGAFTGSGPRWLTSGCKSGGCATFNGTDDMIAVSGLAGTDFTSSWTQSFWVKTTVNSNKVISEKGSNNAFVQSGISSGQIRTGNTVSGFTETTTPGLINDGQWHLVTVTYDDPTNTLNIYRDGTLKGTLNTSSNAANDATPYTLGRRHSSTSAAFSGQIDDAAVWNRALTQSEVSQLFNGTPPSGGTPPPQPSPSPDPLASGLISYWKMDEPSGGVVSDSKGTNSGTTTATVIPGIRNNARSFHQNNNQYVTISDSGSLAVTRFTVSAWVYPTAFNSWVSIFNRRTNPGNQYSYIVELNGSNPGSIACDLDTTAGGSNFYSNAKININTWNFVACTYDGSNVTIYINGTSQSFPKTGNVLSPNGAQTQIGRNLTEGSTWTGYIDEVGVWNKALNASEINRLRTGGPGGTASTYNPTTQVFD